MSINIDPSKEFIYLSNLAGYRIATSKDSEEEGANLIIYYTADPYLLFYLDEERNNGILVSRRTGFVIGVQDGSNKDGELIIQCEWDGEPYSIWEIKDSKYGNVIRFRNKNSGKMMAVKDEEDCDAGNNANCFGDRIIQSDEDYNAYKQMWSFMSTNKGMAQKYTPDPEIMGQVGAFPTYTESAQQQLVDRTPDRIISYTHIPCIMVNDNNWPLDFKIKQSPYYTLEKHQYWSKSYNHILEPGADKIETLELGIEENRSEDFEKKVNISIEIDMKSGLGLFFDKLTLPLKATISQELKVHILESRKDTYKKTVQTKLTNPLKEPRGFTGYVLVNKFLLRRADGTLVDTAGWEVEDPSMTGMTSWPHISKV
ncbi:hypothetical protein EEL32_09690 [Brevibacillus laterosporus]|nr:RICIN domain-containing protein [Brevibacillus laterosporus]TPG88410.1 hypothetical protein EEL32_09690 [Brevibacillus laterosporus]